MIRRRFLGVILSFIIVASVFAGISVNVSAESGSGGDDEELVAYWSFDEISGSTIIDESGNGNNGTNINEVKFEEDLFGKAANFNGKDNYICVPNDSTIEFGTGNFTVEAWIKTGQINFPWYDPYSVIVKKGNPSSNPGWQLLLLNKTNYNGNTIRFGIRDSLDGNGVDVHTNKTVNDNKWHHIVGIKEGNYLKLYVDGHHEDTVDASSESGSLNNNYELHISMYNNAMYFDGLIDEVALYNEAISPDLIKQQYQQKPIAKWKFEDNFQDSIDDHHGEGKNGVKFKEGIIGKAAYFDGLNDYIDIDDNEDFTIKEGSIELWFNTESFASYYQGLITSNVPGTNVNGDFEVALKSDTIHFSIDGPGGPHKINKPYTFNLNQWYHIIVSFGSYGMKLYLNAKMIGMNGYTGVLGTSNHNWEIGSETGTVLKYFKGLIDEVVVYNKALTEDEIKENYNKVPIVKWKFEDDFYDTINSHHGINYTEINFINGIEGKAAIFNGKNDYVYVPQSDDFNLTDFTIEVWFKLNELDRRQCIIGKGYGGDPENDNFYMDVLADNRLRGLYECDNGTNVPVFSKSTIEMNVWYHSALTYSSETHELILYINGQKNNLVIQPKIPGKNSREIYIGKYIGQSGQFHFNGIIDELSIWNRSLNSNEVWDNYFSLVPKYLDISISQDDITFSDPTPSPGKDVTINATVENIGTVSGSAKVKFWDGDPTKITTWTKESGVRVNIGGIYDSVAAVSPEIIKLDNGKYKMYYGGSDSSKSRILSAISTDGINWTKESGIRIDPGTAQAATYPSIIELPNGSFRIYFVENPNGGNNVYIRSAISTDGVNWSKENGKRINYGGTYDFIGASTPEVLQLANGSYRMYYCGVDASWKYRIISAWSSNGISWVKESGIRINVGGTYDSVVAFFPSVFVTVDGRYIMYYAGGNDYTTKKILSATSEDGLLWTKESGIRLDKGGLHDTLSVSTPEVIKLSDDKIQLDYSGKSGTTWRILSATATQNATLIAEKEITNLGPGTKATVNTSWNVPSVPGDYLVYITIEDWSPQDINLSNNVASKSMKVIQLFPIADVGEDQTVNEGDEVILDGSNSKGSMGYYDDNETDPNVVAFWHLDKDSGQMAIDSSGNENHGQLGSTPIDDINDPNWTYGKIGSALKFDGVNEYVEVNDSDSLNFNNESFTIEFWMKHDDLGISSDPSDSDFILTKTNRIGTHYGYEVLLEPYANVNGKIKFSVRDATGDVTNVISNIPVDDNKWHYIACVKDGINSQKIYVDGVPNGTGSPPTGSISNSAELILGGAYYSKTMWKGLLDEIRFSNIVRTPQEISDYYNTHVPVAFWDLNEGSGQIVEDNSGNENHGQLGSTTGIDSSDPKWTTGKIGNALEFDGINDFVNLISVGDDIAGLKEGSLEMWFKIPYTHKNGGGERYLFRARRGGDYGTLSISLRPDGTLRGLVRTGLPQYFVNTEQNVWNANTWYHVSITWSTSETLLYINGELVDSNIGNAVDSSYDQVWLGKYYSTLNLYLFKGTIDEIRIFNIARSAQEIEAYYNKYKDYNDIISFEWDFDSNGEYDYQETIDNAPDGYFDGKTSHTYYENGEYTVTLKVTDEINKSDTDTCVISVHNVVPTITSIDDPIDPIKINNLANITATFTDPGTEDTHTATWAWGDGNETNGTIYNYTVKGSHKYTIPGVYKVNLTVTDDDNGTDWEIYEYIVIYDPDDGFVTGGGWITSPVGAYAADPNATGKANFGFVSKYKNGASDPTGNTEFQFKTGDLNFHSKDYDWLVVAGCKAKYKGTGTINGEGSYKFMLSAIDGALPGGGGEDKFRIKIWEEDEYGNENVIYDNNMGNDEDANPTTVIGGGNIIIHKS